MASVDRWRRVEDVLDAALTREPAEWPALLDASCSGDPELRREVEALLARVGSAQRFLASPPLAAAAALVAEAREEGTTAAYEGRRVGAYRIVREIGRGGMARVFLAERADGAFDQRVALKLLRPGLDTEVDLERFRAERQILATLNHPHIARLLDGGVTDDGRPYLVLEYVDGEPIDRHCATHALSVARRAALFHTVLEATQYAHRNLVVHRDLKPSNILVTRDGAPADAGVKLLDFGLAKLLQPDAAPSLGSYAPPTTRLGQRWMTPEYAAPEQIRGEPVTTLTDVYQLGVVLYELLAGRLPFGTRAAGDRALEDAVLHDEPPAPSSVAASPEARRALRGDLDAIVLRALRKEPERRYPSAAALLDDLQRHRDGRPVLARPDSAAYRARKFVARHRTGVAAGVVFVALLVAAGVREAALRARAEAEAREATAVEQYLATVFGTADPFAAPNVKPADATARTLLDRGAARIDSALAGQPDVQADLRQVLGGVYANLGLYDRAEPLLRRALAQRRAQFGPRHVAVADVMDQLGDVLTQRDRVAEAERLLRDALAMRRQLLDPRDTAVASSADHLATLLQNSSRYDEAERLFRESLAIRRAALGDSSLAAAEATANLGELLFVRGKHDAALPLFQSAVAIEERRLGPSHPMTAAVVHNLAQIYDIRGDLTTAESLYRRALAAKRRSLGDLHPSVTVNMDNLAQVLSREDGKLDEAESLVRQALVLDRRMFGEKHDYVAEDLRLLGMMLRKKGAFAEAEQLFQQALAVNRSLYGDTHSFVAIDLASLGGVRLLEGDTAGAVAPLRDAFAMYQRLQGDRRRNTIYGGLRLARALGATGHPQEAERLFRAELALVDTTTEMVPIRVEGGNGLGRLLVSQGRAAEARPLLERTLALARRGPGVESMRLAEAELALGECLLASGDRAGAEPLLLEARATLAPQRRAQPQLVAQTDRAIARLAAPR